jgi:GNAT superfamily N-acetyltransferase
MITIKKTDPFSEIARKLIGELSEDIARRYDFSDDGSGDFQPRDAAGKNAVFLVASFHNELAGCGALRPLFENEIAEIKRMYVRPAFRGKGIAKKILCELEKEAARMRYKKIWLETGDGQPEAIRLYKKAGYSKIPNYGIYKENQHSNCFEKSGLTNSETNVNSKD